MAITPSTREKHPVNGKEHANDHADPPPVAAEWATQRQPENEQSEEGQLVSEAEYWATYYERSDVSYEWNNGRLERLPMTDYAQFRLYLWFLSLVKDYFHVYPIGRMIGLELGFRLALPGRITIRKPDLAAVLDSNPVPLADKARSYQGIFDLCIESISDSTEYVYNHFISPHLWAERERAERYAALLRSLGVDPDAPQPS